MEPAKRWVLVRVSTWVKNDLYLAALVPYVPDLQTVILPVTVEFVQWPTLSFVRVDEWHANKPSHKKKWWIFHFCASNGNFNPTSRYSAMCSHASSNWFSSNITSNISCGHWANFSAATICTDRFLACAFPRDLIKRCSTCNDQQKNIVLLLFSFCVYAKLTALTLLLLIFK